MATAISSNLEDIIFPKDVWGIIFSYLDDVTMEKVSCVSKLLNIFAEHYYWGPRLTAKKFLTVTNSKSAKGQLADYYNKYCNFFYKKLNLAKPSDHTSVFSHKYFVDQKLKSKDELPKIKNLLINILNAAWQNPNKSAQNLDKELQILFDSGKCQLPTLRLMKKSYVDDPAEGIKETMSARIFIETHCSPITISMMLSMMPEKT